MSMHLVCILWYMQAVLICNTILKSLNLIWLFLLKLKYRFYKSINYWIVTSLILYFLVNKTLRLVRSSNKSYILDNHEVDDASCRNIFTLDDHATALQDYCRFYYKR